MNLLGFWRKWKWKSTVALGMLCSCAQFELSYIETFVTYLYKQLNSATLQGPNEHSMEYSYESGDPEAYHFIYS
ncbi:hypothetical protein EYC84_003605 [Monilinia fructicola]|uniref:Uncharacterized protein n=1 Tax=Monilinia fructicola TaxID=38448 RepID=A0A5M9JZD1_MONFR|nr:hypothetical protein EYC84_003605 [Monilinia fructicola]